MARSMNEMLDGEVMVEGPIAPTWNIERATVMQGAVASCTACSLCRDHVPIAPTLPPDVDWVLVTDHYGSWPGMELMRLSDLVELPRFMGRVQALSCAEPDPVPAQLARCQPNLTLSLAAAGVPVAVVAGDWVVAGLGFVDGDRAPVPAWRLAGRVGIWWTSRDTLEGVYCVFVDLPDGRNKRKVIDQLHVARRILEGDVGPMDLVGAGGCCGIKVRATVPAISTCHQPPTWVDERGLPWCNGHRGARTTR